MNTPRFPVVALLIFSAINLALMVPGGVVETRDFSAYPALVLGGFNVFLTVLGMGSLILAYGLARSGRRYGLATLAGFAYVAVYLLDLGGIFPVTTSTMSTLLSRLEWIGTVSGALLAVAAIHAARRAETPLAPAATRLGFPLPVVAGLAIVALIIIAFATKSAMGI